LEQWFSSEKEGGDKGFGKTHITDVVLPGIRHAGRITSPDSGRQHFIENTSSRNFVAFAL
jgi:hypothetical protein